jgi:type IV pilus assembly protein PilQ
VLGAGLIALSATSASADSIAPNHVRDVRVRAVDDAPGAVEIEIVGTETPAYNVRVADGGKRLFVDITNADVAGAPPAITDPVGVVGGVLTQAFKTPGGQLTRLNVSLSKTASFRARVEGRSLKIALVPGAVTEMATAPATAAKEPEKPAAHAKIEVKDVRFERAPASAAGCSPYGCDRIVVALSQLPAYSLSTGPNGNLRLVLKGALLAEKLARTLDVTAYKGAIKSVSSFANEADGTAIVELSRDGDVQGNLAVEGTNIVWQFALAKGAPVAAKPGIGVDGKAVRTTKSLGKEDDFAPTKVSTSIHDDDANDVKTETVGGAASGFTSTVNGQVRRYTGQRINLDFKDVDIHNILRLFADVGHVNIVTADDVQGSITIKMNNVPWDQALDVVLQAKGLGMTRQGNLIRVAPIATLTKEAELEAARHKASIEQTPLETRIIPVSYAQAEDIVARAKDFLSPRGSLAVDDRTNILIARDIPGNLNAIENLVHTLDTQTSQVLVEARIVEATSRYIRDIGIQWGGDATFSEATGNPTGVAFPSSARFAGGNYDNQTPTAGVSPFTRTVATPNFAVNLPAAVGTGQGGAIGMSFGSIDQNFNLNVRLSAAEASGLLRVVSSPRILTLNNQEARINQGTLIPFAQVSALGVQTTFQEAKLQLLVRPHVTSDGHVAMHVKISRDEPDFNQTSPRGDPTILKREAETDLLIMDGHTAVIGGIYTRNTGRNLDQVPFFGDIPILGLLFQRRRASDTRNELVIFITPRIVNRAESLGK